MTLSFQRQAIRAELDSDTKALCNYHSPAHYDDLLVVTATVKRVTLARIDHYYELRRKGDSLLLASGQTTLACVDAQGQVIPMPEGLKRKRKAREKQQNP